MQFQYIRIFGFMGKINNKNFKCVEMDAFKNDFGKPNYSLTPLKRIEKTNAIGIFSKRDKYNSGTFAHKDIALEFAGWISPEIKLYIIKEFQRLKEKENKDKEWTTSRMLSKANYLLQTSAIKLNLVPILLTKEQINYIYASEPDVLNVALFGKTAKEWRNENPSLKGNIRDYSSSIELIILSNLEYLNSKMIEEGMSRKSRLIKLNKEANKQKEIFIKSLTNGEINK